MPAAADEAERAVRAAFESEIDTGRVDEVVARRDLAIVSLVGDGMRERVGVAGPLLRRARATRA